MVIVDDLDLLVMRGEVVSILGPSGVGKTTLMQLMLQIRAPDKGSVSICGRVLPVFQNFRSMTLPWFSAKRNIIWGAGDAAFLLEEVARILDISGKLDSRPAELSGGQLQRVVLARALTRTPNLLLLDEPLSAVDLTTQRGILPSLRMFLKNNEISAVWITHNLEQALLLSDRIAVMQEGGKFQEIEVQGRSQKEVNASVLEALLAGEPMRS